MVKNFLVQFELVGYEGASDGRAADQKCLARNEDVFFKLGWHVVKNHKFEESNYSIVELKFSEDKFLRDSNWNTLPPDCRGIEALRTRLSSLLFDHIKRNFLPSDKTWTRL